MVSRATSILVWLPTLPHIEPEASSTRMTRCPSAEAAVAVASRSHRDAATDAWLQAEGITDTVSAGSSLKFCLVAEGKADVPSNGQLHRVAIASADTIIEVDDNRVITDIPPRHRMRRGQTPQAFRLGTLVDAYERAWKDPNFVATDDCTVILRYRPDKPIYVVEGSDHNVKITEPIDIFIADKLFQIGSSAAPAHTRPSEYNESLAGKVMVVLGASYGIGADLAALATSFGATVHGYSRSGTNTHVERAEDVEAALDDAFAKSLGIADATVEGLRADIRKNLEREVKFRLLARNKQAVMDALVAKAELDLPNASVQAEIARLMEGARAELKQRGIKDADKAEIPEDVFRPQAERRVRLGLVVAELVRANELQAKPEQLKAHIDELAASYEKPEDVVRWYFGDRQRLAEVEAVVIENNVTEFVLSKAKVVEKAVSFDELMGQG